MRPSEALSLASLIMLIGSFFSHAMLQIFTKSKLVCACKRAMHLLVMICAQTVRNHNDCSMCCTTFLVIVVAVGVALVCIA